MIFLLRYKKRKHRKPANLEETLNINFKGLRKPFKKMTLTNYIINVSL